MTESDEIEVCRTVSEALAGAGVEMDVTPRTELSSLHIDSLGLIEVVFALEERFDVQLPFNANEFASKAGEGVTVGDLIAMVDSSLEARSRSA